MYLEHFHLQAQPFENTPDPAYFYMGHTYREILAVMIHCIVSRKGLMVLSGAVGSGKTTLSRTVARYVPERTMVINVIHPPTGEGRLLSFLAKQLGVEDYRQPHIFLVDEIKAKLLEIHHDGGRCVLIVDEAQFLTDVTFEEVRLLTNLETDQHKLIQTLLLGQPELSDKLQRPEVLPLRQRVAIFKTLEPMDETQTLGYIAHRLKAAGGSEKVFTNQALHQIIAAAGGIPRVINRICDAALLGAFAADHDRVQVEDVTEAVTDVMGPTAQADRPDHPAPEPAPEPIPSPPRIEPQADWAEPEPEIAPPGQPSPQPRRPSPPRRPAKRSGWGMPLVLLCLALASLAVSAWFYVANMPDPAAAEPANRPAQTKPLHGG